MATPLVFRHHYHRCMATSMSLALTHIPKTGIVYKKVYCQTKEECIVVLLYCQGDPLSGTQKIPRVKKIGLLKKGRRRRKVRPFPSGVADCKTYQPQQDQTDHHYHPNHPSFHKKNFYPQSGQRVYFLGRLFSRCFL